MMGRFSDIARGVVGEAKERAAADAEERAQRLERERNAAQAAIAATDHKWRDLLERAAAELTAVGFQAVVGQTQAGPAHAYVDLKISNRAADQASQLIIIIRASVENGANLLEMLTGSSATSQTIPGQTKHQAWDESREEVLGERVKDALRRLLRLD